RRQQLFGVRRGHEIVTLSSEECPLMPVFPPWKSRMPSVYCPVKEIHHEKDVHRHDVFHRHSRGRLSGGTGGSVRGHGGLSPSVQHHPHGQQTSTGARTRPLPPPP